MAVRVASGYEHIITPDEIIFRRIGAAEFDGGPLVFGLTSLLIAARDQDDARAKGITLAQRVFPPVDGWCQHQAQASPLIQAQAFVKAFG
jgi:hypothetical protein